MRLWSSPTRRPRGATNLVQIELNSARFLPSFQGRWPCLIRRNCCCPSCFFWSSCGAAILFFSHTFFGCSSDCGVPNFLGLLGLRRCNLRNSRIAALLKETANQLAHKGKQAAGSFLNPNHLAFFATSFPEWPYLEISIIVSINLVTNIFRINKAPRIHRFQEKRPRKRFSIESSNSGRWRINASAPMTNDRPEECVACSYFWRYKNTVITPDMHALDCRMPRSL